MNVNDIEQRIRQHKTNIAGAKAQRDRLQGSLDTIMEQLQKEFGVTTLQEAELLLEQETDTLRIEEQKIESMLRRLSDQYGITF